jgi:cytochrome c556
MRTRHLALLLGSIGLIGLSAAGPASGQNPHDHSAHGKTAVNDPRTLVTFPDQMKAHTLSSMREHLSVISQLQSALAAEKYDEAAKLAEFKLGMSSLAEHVAHDASKFMPKGMQDVGTLMHRSASQFAIEAQNAAATGDGKKALAALSKVTQACVACHAGYRLQ